MLAWSKEKSGIGINSKQAKTKLSWLPPRPSMRLQNLNSKDSKSQDINTVPELPTDFRAQLPALANKTYFNEAALPMAEPETSCRN